MNRNPKSRLLLLLFEVVENKIARDKQGERDADILAAVKENKYHLVQNYNNDLIRRSLKSTNNHNRLNIKENKVNYIENITKKGDERYKKKMMTVVGQGHNQFKSLGTQKRTEELKIDVPHADSTDRINARGDRGSNLSYAGQSPSSTPNSNMSLVMNKSSGAQAAKKDPKLQEMILHPNNQTLAVKNSLIQRIKKRNTSKVSDRSDRSASRDNSGLRGSHKPVTKPIGVNDKLSRQVEEHVLHLTLNGVKHNTNLVQINNYINKAENESVGVSDNKSHRQSAGSNNSNLNSIKLRNIRKAISVVNKDAMMGTDYKNRAEGTNPLKPAKTQYNQPLLSSIQNKNVLTLAQNLLNKRSKND